MRGFAITGAKETHEVFPNKRCNDGWHDSMDCQQHMTCNTYDSHMR